jgi:hypothetical protein
MDNLPEGALVNLLRLGRDWCADSDEAKFSQVRKQDADHTERKVDI